MATTANQDSKEIRFTAAEAAALRLIVTDWLNEGLVQPPYEEAMMSAVGKLGLAPSAGPQRARDQEAAERQQPEEPQFFRPRPNKG